MRLSLRRQVRQRDGWQCVYCGVTEEAVGAELTVDHFQPVRQGGSDTLENLVYACHACNEFKGDFWSAEPEGRLLHPHLEEVAQHIHVEETGFLVGLTARGSLHIETLHLNRAPLVAHRLQQRRVAEQLQRERRLEARLEQMDRRLAHLESIFGLKPGESEP